MEYVPKKSEVDTNYIKIGPHTRSMLKELGMNGLPKITSHLVQTRYAAGVREILEYSSAGEVLLSQPT